MAWRNFGISLYQAQRMVEAIEPLKKATETGSQKTRRPWVSAGRVHGGGPLYLQRRLGSKIEVTPRPGTIEAYQKAIDLDPNGPLGYASQAGPGAAPTIDRRPSRTKVGNKKKKP